MVKILKQGKTMTHLYGIPNCDTVKKARSWLDEHNIPFEFHSFKQQPPTQTLIQQWLKDIPIETLLNKKGSTWRKLSTAEQIKAGNIENAIELMTQQPSLIKRPVLVHKDKAYCGFQAALYANIFNLG